MTIATGPRKSAGNHAGSSGARLASGTVLVAVAGFVAFVVLPGAVGDFVPPAGLDVLWRLGGPLALVLAPVAAGLAGCASCVELWVRHDLGPATRRVHLVVLVAVAAFAVFLVSPAGQSVIRWWQD